MSDRKRAFDEDAEGGGPGRSSQKLAKKAGASDVAASKATTKKGSAGRANVPPKGQDVEGNAYWELSKMRRIGISNFRGTTLINIREYYESAGQMRPGKKGISLSIDQYKALLRAIPDINAELEKDGETLSDADDGGDGEAAEGGAATKAKKAKAPKKSSKSNIEATSDEDSS